MRERSAILGLVSIVALLAALPVRAQYTYRNVADSTMTVPEGGSAFAFFSNIRASASINNDGVVAFNATSIYTNDGVTTRTVIASGTSAPGGGTFVQLFNPVIGDSGLVVSQARFTAGLDYGHYGVDATGGAITRIAASGQPAPGGGTFQTFDFGGFTPSVSPTGQVAFWGDTATTSGIYVFDGVSTVRISARGDALPGGGTANIHDEPDINAAGQVAFYSSTVGGPARGVYRYDDDTGLLTRLAATGESAPGGGTFDLPGTVSMNNLGDVAFQSSTVGGPTNGLYVASGGSLSRIAAIGDPLLAGGPGASFWIWKTINDNGLIAFATRTGAGASTALQGIYTSNGTTTNKVVELGDTLFGSIVTQLGFNKQAMNDGGQVVFNYTLADGRLGIGVASPSAVAAPEPASFALLTIGSLLAPFLRRPKQH